MPTDPIREGQVAREIEQDFARIEEASLNGNVGVLDVLEVYGGLQLAVEQAEAYLSLLNPTPVDFSTTSSSNAAR